MKLRSFILAGFLFLTLSLGSSFAQVGISINFAPPPLPVVVQPLCPVAGYIWTPGYWAWGVSDYYWVPGAWVPPPAVGLLWTPPWWGWSNGVYVFNEGHWGPRVGFYGGINYGYGYFGSGYWGGHWEGNTFQYNTAVTHVNTNVVHNTYVDQSVNRQLNATRASFNGPNGVNAQETAAQKAAGANAKKVGPTSQQLGRQQAASKDNNLKASVNKGNPNADAINSFNKGGGAAQIGKDLQAADKLGNFNRQGAGAGNIGEHGNKVGAGNQMNKQRNLQGNQAKMHAGKTAGSRGPARGQHAMNQQMQHHPQTGAGKHPQPAGKRGHAGGQPQGKKKEGKPER